MRSSREYSRWLSAFAILAAIVFLPGHIVIADTTVAYTTLDAAGNIPVSASWGISDPNTPYGPTAALELAVPFSAIAGGLLQSVELPIGRKSLTASSTTLRTLSLAADAGGKPGAVLESWSIVPPLTATMVRLASVNRPAITMGTKYWFTAHINPTGTGADSWLSNGLGLAGPMLYRRSTSVPLASFAGSLPAFRINLGSALLINGACGAAAKSYVSTDTSFAGAFCLAGTTNPASPAFPEAGASVSWQCLGAHGGTNANCSATRSSGPPPINGSCGAAAKSYAYTDTSFAGALCSAGTASPASPAFPEAGASVSWQCLGAYGGANVSCSASRAVQITVAYTTLDAAGNIPTTTASWGISDPNAPYGPTAALELAVPFSAIAGGLLQSVELPIGRKSLTASSTTLRTLSLAADAGGKPGAVLESWSIVPPLTATMVRLASVNRPAITMGTKYWFTAHINPTGTGADSWLSNGLGLAGPMLYRRSTSVPLASFAGSLPAFRINLGSVPSPNSPSRLRIVVP